MAPNKNYVRIELPPVATGFSVDDEIKRDDQRLRRRVATLVVWRPIAGTVVTWLAVGFLVGWDAWSMQRRLITAGDRIVTLPVIMTALAATAAQIGAIALTIARHLFPGSVRYR